MLLTSTGDRNESPGMRASCRARRIRRRLDARAGYRIEEIHALHVELKKAPFALLWQIVRRDARHGVMDARDNVEKNFMSKILRHVDHKADVGCRRCFP